MKIGDREYNCDDKLEIIKDVQSSISISDIKNFIDALCPIRIIIDGKVVWDEDTEDDINVLLDHYEKITTSKMILTSFGFKVVSYHHSIIFINTEETET